MENDITNTLTQGIIFTSGLCISANVLIGATTYALFRRKIITPSELEKIIAESNPARKIIGAVTYPARYLARKAYERNNT